MYAVLIPSGESRSHSRTGSLERIRSDHFRLLQMEFQRDFLKKTTLDPEEAKKELTELSSAIQTFTCFNDRWRWVHQGLILESAYLDRNYLNENHGINVEIDESILVACKEPSLWGDYIQSPKTLCLMFESPDEISHDLSRVNANVAGIEDIRFILCIAFDLILKVNANIVCPLTADGENDRNLDIGYWYNEIGGEFIPQDVWVENLKPVDGKRVNFHIHTESSRYYKPKRRLLIPTRVLPTGREEFSL